MSTDWSIVYYVQRPFGAKIDMLESFDPKMVWQKLLDRNNDINVFMAVPTVYSKLIETCPNDTDSNIIKEIIVR